ncbi:MAG: LysR substrate-binding protein [Ramlibacter sp.]|nr:LysR substrate-binding protein [Ramlibacter sp.]
MQGAAVILAAMKLHFLRYFAVLAEELHFGRAAERLSITQPPLSSAIKALEEELGTRLFVRDSKRVELTPAGAAFLDHVRLILGRVERAKDAAKSVASGMRGRLDIGMTGSLLYREVPRIVQQFTKAHPDIELTLRELGTAAQIEALMHGELHAGFFNAASAPPQLRSIALRPDRFMVCLPESHRLAGRKGLRLSELADERFVMFDRNVAPGNYDNVIATFSRAGLHPRTFHAATQWMTIVSMVAMGFDVGVVPESLARSGVRGVRFVPLKDELAVSPALLAWNPSVESQALRNFIAAASALLQAGAKAPRRFAN